MEETILIGRCGADPELRNANGKSVCNVNLATTRGWGEEKKTVWTKITLWEKNADNAAKFLKKGSQVAFRGLLDFETYEKDGKTNVTRKLTAHYMEFLGGGEKQEQQAPSQNSYEGFTEPNEADMSQVPF